MELGRVIEGGTERASSVAPRSDVAIRESAPPTGRPLEGSRPPSTVQGQRQEARQLQLPSDVWAGAISRLQTQVSYNTSMLESHRRQVNDIEQAVGRLQVEMTNVFSILNEVRGELRTRPMSEPQHQRHDQNDLDVFASQMASVTNKANEVDGLRMQLELVKNRMKRIEEHDSSVSSSQRPPTGARESYETAPASILHAPARPQHQSHQPMRMLERNPLFASPPSDPSRMLHAPPVLPSQPHHTPTAQAPGDNRPQLSEQRINHPQSSVLPDLRPSERLPPQPVLSGWRPADSQHSGLPPPPLQQPQSFRSFPAEVEQPATGWAAVNQPMKRPLEDQHRSPYDAPPVTGSPKRPRLAPIMPRSNYPEENLGQQAGPTSTPESQFHSRSRAQSSSSQNQPTGPFRFITSIGQTGSREPWRQEPEHMLPHSNPTQRGRGGGGGGRGSRGGRGGRRRGGHDLHSPHNQQDETSSLGAGTPPDATLTANDPSPHTEDEGSVGGPGSNKKTRTKPIRNADGVLIRKDGRPDMRSVSSANNLRRVHARKEEELQHEELMGRMFPFGVAGGLGREREGAGRVGSEGVMKVEPDDEHRRDEGRDGEAAALARQESAVEEQERRIEQYDGQHVERMEEAPARENAAVPETATVATAETPPAAEQPPTATE